MHRYEEEPQLSYHFKLHHVVKMIMSWLELSSSSSSSCVISTDIPDLLSPSFPVVNCFRQVFRATSRFYTELLFVGSSSSCSLCLANWRGPLEYITYELVPTSAAVSRMSGSSNFDSFWDGWQVGVQLLLCGCCQQDLFNIARSILV